MMLQVTGKRPETISLKARPEGVFVLGDHRNELQEAGIDLESDSRILVRDACTREIRWDPFNMDARIDVSACNGRILVVLKQDGVVVDLDLFYDIIDEGYSFTL